MVQPSIEEQMYRIISFSDKDAHIVETSNVGNVFSGKAYHVFYDELRYLYIDLVSEAESVFQQRRQQIDPRIFIDPNSTVDTLLALPQMQDSQLSREELEKGIELDKYMAKCWPEMFQEFVSRYERYNNASDEELKTIIAGEINEKIKYVPKEIRLTPLSIALGLPQAGYMLVESKLFTTLQSALDTLYSAWKEVKADGQMDLCLFDPTRVSHETRDRLR